MSHFCPINAGVCIKEEDDNDKQGNFSHDCHSFELDIFDLASESDHLKPLDGPDNLLAILLADVESDRLIFNLESVEEADSAEIKSEEASDSEWENEEDSDDDDSKKSHLDSERDEDHDISWCLNVCNAFGLDEASGLLDPNEQLNLSHFDADNLNWKDSEVVRVKRQRRHLF